MKNKSYNTDTESIHYQEVIKDETIYDTAQRAIKKGEKVKMLFEWLLQELNMSLESTYTEVFAEILKTHNAYEEGVKLLASAIHQNANNKFNKEAYTDAVKGVSDHYDKETPEPNKMGKVSVSN